MLPHHLGNDFGKVVVSVIVYKWANKHSLATYLTRDTKVKGNLSEVAFTDIVKGWGTTTAGNLAGRMASATYQLLGIISELPGISEMIPRTYFMSGGDIRKKHSPARQVVERKGRETKLVQKGEINVLRFDNVRFLLPSERNALKSQNEASDLETKIRAFDATLVKDRDYPKLETEVKQYFDSNSKLYFALRRLARQRLYAVKEVKREAKQSDQIPDSDFGANDFIDTVVKQAESLIVDIDRKRSIIDRLSINVLSPIISADTAEMIGDSLQA